MNRKIVEVIDPSPGLWGGEPIPGLITIVYLCPDPSSFCPRDEHTHHALYGPADEDNPGGEGMSLYAD